VTLGSLAPALRLPSAQGPTIDLSDFRGRRHVIVWFTKGLACPFCRRQMLQLAQIAPKIRGLDTEVLEIASTPVERAAIYHRRFTLPFLYLCDPDFAAAKSWGLEVRPHPTRRFLRRVDYPPGGTPFDAVAPTPGEIHDLTLDDDRGFFVVDRASVVRYVSAGSYYTKMFRVPNNESLLDELKGLG
jgi:peroxiredoxin